MTQPFELSSSHMAAVNRQRRIIVQYDAADTPLLGMDINRWVAYRFNYIDEPGTQIDSIWWDIALGNDAVYPSKILPPNTDPNLAKWRGQGLDWIKIVVEESHKRGKEAFWNARISEVETNPQGLEMEKLFPVKAEHPDWVIKTWWWQGM